MSITLEEVQNLAPDQASLTAAKKLLNPKKWSVKSRNEQLIWGDCQGSGANPYHAVFDLDNHGYKCSCPSRKFPCKHVLALAWQFSTAENDFQPDEIPSWVSDWLGRRRNTGSAKPTTTGKNDKNIHAVEEIPPEKIDPKKQAAAAKRAAENKAKTDAAVSAGLIEFQQWLNDQLRLGLAVFVEEIETRCRQIGTRLVDAKAAVLASRIDQLPQKIADLPPDVQIRGIINELGKIVWLTKAWQKNPENPDVRRAILSAEKRDLVLENSQSLRLKGTWQVVGEKIFTRRDNLISHATWLICRSKTELGKFALLQDYYPVSTGKREQTLLGQCYEAEMVFFPSQYPLRAVMDEQKLTSSLPILAVADQPMQKFYQQYQQVLSKIPWLEEMPYLLPAGRIIRSAEHGSWWQSAGENRWHLPVSTPKVGKNEIDLIAASELENTFILWDGIQGHFGSADTKNWGLLCQ